MKKLIAILALLSLLLTAIVSTRNEELREKFTKSVVEPKEDIELIQQPQQPQQPQQTSEPTVIEIVKDNVYFVAMDAKDNIPTLIQRFSEEHEKYKVVGIETAMLNEHSLYGVYLIVEYIQ